MKSQGEVDAQYDAAHSYILQVQPSTGWVLEWTDKQFFPSSKSLPCPALCPNHSPALCPNISPAICPKLSPAICPNLSPALCPNISPALCLNLSPALCPNRSPALCPNNCHALCPNISPALCLNLSPALCPNRSPALCPNNCHALCPNLSPALCSSPSLWPAICPSISPAPCPNLSPVHCPSPSLCPALCPRVSPTLCPSPPACPTICSGISPTLCPSPTPCPSPTHDLCPALCPNCSPCLCPSATPCPSPLSTFAPPSAPELAPPSALPQPLAPPLSSTFALPCAPSSTLALSPAFAPSPAFPSPSAPAPPSAASLAPAPPSALFSPTSQTSAPPPLLAVTSATTPGCICPPRDTANASGGAPPQSHIGIHDNFGKQPDVEEVTSTKSTSQEDGARSWAGGGGGGRGGGGGGGRHVADKKPSVEDVTSTKSTSREDGVRTGATAGGCRDFASKKRRLEDVTNTHNTGPKGRQIISARKEPKTAKRHFRPCSSGSRFSNYDADLYWTGRKISVEGSGKGRPKKGHGQGRDLCVFVGGRRRSTGDSEGSRRVKDAEAAVDRASRRNSGDKLRKEQDGHDINTFDRRRDDIQDVTRGDDVGDVTQTDNVEGVTQGDDVGNVTQIDNVEDIRHGDDADGVMQDDDVEDVRQDDDADHVTHNDGVEDARHGVGVETHASAHRRRTSSEGTQTVQQQHDDPVGRSDGSNTHDTGRRASAEVPDGERHKEKKTGRQLPHGDCPVAQDVLQSESRRKADGRARLTATTHRQGTAPQRKEQQHDLAAPNKRGHDSLKAAKSSGEGSSARVSGVAESLCCVLHKHQTEDDTAQTTYHPAKGHQHCSRDKGQAHGKYQGTPEVVLSFRDGSVGPQARYSAGASESLKGFRDAVKVPSGSPSVAGTRQLPPGAAETTRSSSGVADTTHIFRDTVEASEAFRDTVEAPEAFRDTSRAPGASWDTDQAPEGCWSPAEGVSSFQGAERGPAGGSSRRSDAAEDVFRATSTTSRGQKHTSLRDTALMTVCDQAVHLPLPPQPDHAEDQPPAPPAPPLHPAPAHRRVAKDCADPGVPDDPAPPGACANATPALNFPQPQARPGPRGQDEVRQLCHGGALPEGERVGGIGEDPEASVELPEQQRAPGSHLRRASSPEGSEGELPVHVPGTGHRSVGSVQASAMPDLRGAAGKEGTKHAPASGSGSRPPEPAGGVCGQLGSLEGQRGVCGQRGSLQGQGGVCGQRDSLQGQGGVCCQRGSLEGQRNVFGSPEGQDEDLVKGPAVGAQSRDAEVQTVADGALTRAHLTPLVETACQTGGRPAEETSSDRAASRRDRVDRKADTARSAPRSAKRPTELHVHSGGQRGSLGDGRAKVGGGKGSRSSSRPKPRGAGKDKRDATKDDVQSFSGEERVPLLPASSEQQPRQTEASGFRQREREESARMEQEPLDLSPGAVELQASLRPTETPAAAVVAVVRRKRPDKKPDQSCRDDGKDKEAGSQQHGPPDSTKRHGVHGDLREPRDPGKNHAKHSVRGADHDDDGEKDEEESAGAGNFSFRPDEVPEMQVMVNSLTPVLQRRRSAARRSNSHTGASSSSSAAGTPCTEDQLHRLLASFAASAESPERVEVDLPEPRRQAGRSSAKAKASREQTPDHRHESGAERASEVSGGSLFIKPKFARTWHGPVQAGSGRAAAPRMGVAMMTSDAASLTLGHGARAGGPGGGGGVGSHVHTMPVISRTLLDALHKRYCSYQYSSGGWSPLAAPLPPPAPPTASLTLHLPPQLASAPLKKLNSEGESDTGSSAPTSTQSSPRTLHTLGEDGGGGGGDGGDHEGQASPDSSPATEQKRNGRGKEEEIEAIEACQWLRAAGFPQYAQMFEDGLFPLDTWDVQRDHDFLDSDSIQSVIRRLNILNTCAVMKIDAQPSKKATEESDEEDLCALSDRWEYQKTVRRWSRKGPDLTLVVDSTLEPSSSHDSLLGEESGSHTDDSPMLDSKMPHTTAVTTSGEQAPDSSDVVLGVEPPEPLVEGLIPPSSQGSSFPVSPKLRRAASERLKSALKKMESFKKKSKKYPTSRNIVEISDPVVADQEEMQAKLQHLNCVDIGPNGVGPTPIAKQPSPPVGESTPMDKVSHGIASPDSSSLSPISPASPVVPPPAADAAADSSASSQTDSSSLSEYYTAHTQLLANFQACSGSGKPLGGSLGGRKSSDSSLVEIFLLPQDHKPGSFPRLLKNGYIDTAIPFQASLPAPQAPPSGASLPRDPQGLRGSVGHKGGAKSAASRVSVYDNFPAVGSPQHSAEGNKALEDRLDARLQLGRQSQAVRSLSISSSGSGAKLEAESSETGGMVRSLSASAATSMEFQASSGRASLASDYLGSLRGSTARKSSVAMDEFDAILQNLYQDISNLSRSIGQDEEQEHDLDIAAVRCGSTPSREVTFSITEQNGDIGDHSVDNSTSGSIKLETQLSQTSASETDSFRLGPLSPVCVNDSMEGEEGDLCSQTTSSQDSSDDVEGSADDTLERIALGARERRDSGVGSSLTRASSERKRKKIRWESFQKCHRPSRASRELQIGGLSVCQLLPLRQLSLLKLTSIMEKCSPTNRSQWSWSVPRFMKRNKAPHFSDKNVFGVPFTIMLQRTGQPLPQCVLYAMRYLRKTSHDALGIFRKSGVRSRIQKLRDLVESNPDSINFDELQPYDVADLLKQYFRELPECLLTNKLSDTFRSIFTHVPQSQRLEALQTAVILLPEENREVLHCLLLFLGDIAQHADKHQMNASNLAVCFAPSLFNFLGSHGTNSPRRQRKTPGVPEQRELLEQKAVHECFTYMITDCKKLFMVPPSMYSRLHLSTLSNMEPVHLDEFYAKSKQPGPDFKAFGEEHIQMLLKEVHDKARGWVPATVGVPGIEALHRKPQDGHPLRQWKCSVEIEAPPVEVLNRILHERHKWDDDMLSWDVVERLDRNSDVFHYVLNTMAPHPPRHFMVIRYWRPDLVKGACALVSKSVEHSGALAASAEYDQGVRAVELGSFYLMEPCGSGRSRLTYISRTDLRGRCPEWYNRVFGHMCANFLDRLRDSFRQEAEGPETKV